MIRLVKINIPERKSIRTKAYSIAVSQVIILAGIFGAVKSPGENTVLEDQVKAIHRKAILIDGHNDWPWHFRTRFDRSFEKLDLAKPSGKKAHTDIPRLVKAGLGAQFWSAFVPSDTMKTGDAARICLEQIDIIHQLTDRYSSHFELAYSTDDIRRIHANGKIASLIGIEGGHTIENSLGVLRNYYRLGTRYLTLTHADSIDWADAATDTVKHMGLSEFGEEVVREMNHLGMLIDISHVSDETMSDVLDLSKAPIIASHSSARAIADHVRNIPDDILKRVATNGGVIMVNFFSGFVEPKAAEIMKDMFDVNRELKLKFPIKEDYDRAKSEWRRQHPMPRGDVRTVVDHIDHIVSVAGIDHVGLGSDYDGVSLLPEGLEDVSKFPNITYELLRRNYDEESIIKILGENLMRAFKRAEEVSYNLSHP